MSTTLMAQPNYGSVASSSSVVSTDADTDEEASTPQQITSLERISDARSRFSHTKALFQQLERCASDQLPSFYSPRLQRSATVPAQQAQLQLQQQQQKAECPAVPPKPAKKPIAQNVFIDNQKNRVGALKPNGSATDSKPLAANGGTPGSPLTQVARNFSQLANDLEILTNSPRNTGGISSKNRNAVTSPTDAGDALRGFVQNILSAKPFGTMEKQEN